MKQKTFFIVLLLLLINVSLGLAEEISGTVTRSNFQVGECAVSSMSVKYRLNTLLGEPVVNGVFEWTAEPGTSSDCLNYSTVIYLKVSGSGGHGYIKISPSVPDSGEGYGFNTSGSPDWDEVICGTGTQENDCLTEDQAKNFWKSGFSVDSFEVGCDSCENNADNNTSSGGNDNNDNGGIVSGESDLGFDGQVSYFIENEKVIVEAEKILNSSNTGSGSIKLELYATSSKYTGGTLSGHLMGEFDFNDPLDANTHYYDIQKTDDYVQPPDGSYYVTLLLLEYQDTDFYIVDYITFDNQLKVNNDQDNNDRWVNISGLVTNEDGIPLCAMVLANGEYMFTCDPNGEYDLRVPPDEDGHITIFAFCDGLAPYKEVIPSDQPDYDIDIVMSPVSIFSPVMEVTRNIESLSKPGWVRISGEVTNEYGVGLCAMILANGEYMFTCGDSQGSYELEVPLNQEGEITLFGFCDGIQPFTKTLIP